MFDRDYSVGIATRYGLDGSRDRIPVEERFPAPDRTGLVLTQLPIQKVPGHSGGVALNTHPHLGPRLNKKCTGIARYPSGLSWRVLWWTFTNETRVSCRHTNRRTNTRTWRITETYVEIKCQLDATEVFIADLIACSTCFEHHYAHHQELKSIIQWLLPVVFRAVKM